MTDSRQGTLQVKRRSNGDLVLVLTPEFAAVSGFRVGDRLCWKTGGRSEAVIRRIDEDYTLGPGEFEGRVVALEEDLTD